MWQDLFSFLFVKMPKCQINYLYTGLVQNWERSMSRLYTVTCLFNLYAEYIMQNAGLEEAQAGIKISGRNISNLIYADDTTLTAESKELKMTLLMKGRGEWKK